MEKNKTIHPKQTAIQSKRSMIISCSVLIVMGLMAIWIGLQNHSENESLKYVFTGSFFLILALYNWLKEGRLAWELDHRGVTTTGTIIDKWEDPKFLYIFMILEGGGPVSWVAYEYLGGLRAKQVVERKLFKSLKVGTAVTVCYLPGRQESSRLDFSNIR